VKRLTRLIAVYVMEYGEPVAHCLYRVFIVILCGVSILWIPLVQSSAGGQLFIYIQSIQGYLGTPIGLLFTMAIFWRPMNEQVIVDMFSLV